MSAVRSANPYAHPGAYEVLGIDPAAGVRMGGREIGAIFNKEKLKARRSKNVQERAARLTAIEEAKESLISPGNRILVDFFILPARLLADVCRQFSKRLGDMEIHTQEVIGAFFPKKRFDDLTPDSFDQFIGELEDIEAPTFQEEERVQERLPLAVVEL